MKLLCLVLPLLGSLAIAQSLVEDNCQCPQVKCPDTDTFEGCRCANLAELRCKRRCPYKKSTTKFRICSLLKRASTLPPSPSAPSPPPVLDPQVPNPVKAALPSDSVLPDRPLVPGCECEEKMCIASYPEGCYCQYGIKKNCYDKCGGPSPGLINCPSVNPINSPFELSGPVERDAIPEPQVSTVPIPVDIPVNNPVPTGLSTKDQTAKCTCEDNFCVQSWPESCTCANANKIKCWEKCGGLKPVLQSCPALDPLPALPRTPPTESRTYQVCGGNRLGANVCPDGYICMNDPFKKGCGLECDATGICVQNKLCGGFGGIRCPDSRQVCVDAPNDGCDPQKGGADCSGVCVWPPELRTD